MIQIKRHPALSLSLLIFTATAIASTESISLKSCIEKALSNNKQLIVSKGNSESSIAVYETSRSSLLPQVSLSSNAGKDGSGSTVNSGNLSAGVDAKMQVFDFGKSYSKIAGSERLLRASESDALSTRQNVILSVCTSYYNCLAAKALSEVSRESLKLAETHRDQAAILLEAGRGVKFNVLRAEVDVENNRLSVIKAENSVEVCRLTLANALGTTLADTLAFSDSLTETVAVPSLEAIRRTAQENRPELKSARLKLEAAGKSVTSAECSRYPAISSSAGAGMQSPLSPMNWKDNWSIGLGLSLPLYQGGAISAAIRQAQGSRIAAEGNLAIAEQNVLFDVEQQYQSLKVAMASIEVAKKVVQSASDALIIAQERYKVGSGSPLEISDAELVFSNAKISYIQAVADLNSVNAGLMRAMGILSQDFSK